MCDNNIAEKGRQKRAPEQYGGSEEELDDKHKVKFKQLRACTHIATCASPVDVSGLFFAA